MTDKDKDKELLLKDLCTRLPYGTIIRVKSNNADEPFVDEVLNTFNLHAFYDSIEFIKPYLRPMSSMIEEEESEYYSLGIQPRVYNIDFLVIDWLNAHHFDYRGLIEKGLALEAPEGMYEIK